MANKNLSVTFYQTIFSGPFVWKDVNNEKKMSQKLNKFARFVKKNALIRHVKMLKPFDYQ